MNVAIEDIRIAIADDSFEALVRSANYLPESEFHTVAHNDSSQSPSQTSAAPRQKGNHELESPNKLSDPFSSYYSGSDDGSRPVVGDRMEVYWLLVLQYYPRIVNAINYHGNHQIV